MFGNIWVLPSLFYLKRYSEEWQSLYRRKLRIGRHKIGKYRAEILVLFEQTETAPILVWEDTSSQAHTFSL